MIDRLGAGPVRVTATSAARDAANRDEFFDAAEAALGARPELLSGLEEGAALVRRRHRRPRSRARPVPRGRHRRRLDRVLLRHDATARPADLDRDGLRAVHREVHRARSAPARGAASPRCRWPRPTSTTPASPSPRSLEARTFVGLAGTVSTAAAVELGLATYDRDRIHHFELTKAAVEDVFRTLATETRAERLENPGLEEARADVIVGGHVHPRDDHAPARARVVPGQRGRHPRRPGASPRCSDASYDAAVPLSDRVLMGPGPSQPLSRGGGRVRPAAARPPRPRVHRAARRDRRPAPAGVPHRQPADVPGQRHRLGRHGGRVRQRGAPRRRRGRRRQRRVRRAHVRRGRPLRRRGRAGRGRVGPAARSRRRCSTPTRRRSSSPSCTPRRRPACATTSPASASSCATRTPRRSCWSTASRRSAASPSRSTAGQVDLAYSGTQKCLGVPPGLAPFTAGARALDRLRRRSRSRGTSTSTCSPSYVTGEGARAYHHTAPISMIFALHAGLGALLDEGLDASFARHQACGEALQAGLVELGFELFAAGGPPTARADHGLGADRSAARRRRRGRRAPAAARPLRHRDRRRARRVRRQGLAHRLHGPHRPAGQRHPAARRPRRGLHRCA